MDAEDDCPSNADSTGDRIPVERALENESVEGSGSLVTKVKWKSRARGKPAIPAVSVSSCDSSSGMPRPSAPRKSLRVRQPPVKFRTLVPKPLVQRLPSLPPFAQIPQAPPNGLQPLPQTSADLFPTYHPFRLLPSTSLSPSTAAVDATQLLPVLVSLPPASRTVDLPEQPTSLSNSPPAPGNVRSVVHQWPTRVASDAPIQVVPVSSTSVAQPLPSTERVEQDSLSPAVQRSEPVVSTPPSATSAPTVKRPFHPAAKPPRPPRPPGSKPPLPPCALARKALRGFPRGPGINPALSNGLLYRPPFTPIQRTPTPTPAPVPVPVPASGSGSAPANCTSPLIVRQFPFNQHIPPAPAPASPSSRPPVPWLIPPYSTQDGADARPGLVIPLPTQENGVAAGKPPLHGVPRQDSGTIVRPEQSRSQTKRRLKMLQNGVSKKIQTWGLQSHLLQEVDANDGQKQEKKRLVISEEQRNFLMQKVMEGCRTDPQLRATFLKSVKQLADYGVLQSSAYSIVAQGSCSASQGVVDAWKQMPSHEEGSASASIHFYEAVDKLHSEGETAMEKLPRLHEASPCSLTKISSGVWQVSIPDIGKKPSV